MAVRTVSVDGHVVYTEGGYPLHTVNVVYSVESYRLGSSAQPEGGILGRADAFIGSIEAQKAGSLHIHGHLFLQNLHQHTPLLTLLERLEREPGTIVEDYLRYKAHVVTQMFLG